MTSNEMVTLLNEQKAVNVWDKIITKLTAFNYEVQESDAPILVLCFDKVETEIKLNCNIKTVPASVDAYVIDAVAGEFLKTKRVTGAYDVGAVISSVSMGDTSIAYGQTLTLDVALERMTDLTGVCKCLRTIRF